MNICTVEQGDTSGVFRAECEARYVLSKNYTDRDVFMGLVRQKRGAAAAADLAHTCRQIEPSYVLDLPNREQRQDYIANLAKRYGKTMADRLRSSALVLHERRKSALK